MAIRQTPPTPPTENAGPGVPSSVKPTEPEAQTPTSADAVLDQALVDAVQETYKDEPGVSVKIEGESLVVENVESAAEGPGDPEPEPTKEKTPVSAGINRVHTNAGNLSQVDLKGFKNKGPSHRVKRLEFTAGLGVTLDIRAGGGGVYPMATLYEWNEDPNPNRKVKPDFQQEQVLLDVAVLGRRTHSLKAKLSPAPLDNQFPLNLDIEHNPDTLVPGFGLFGIPATNQEAHNGDFWPSRFNPNRTQNFTIDHFGVCWPGILGENGVREGSYVYEQIYLVCWKGQTNAIGSGGSRASSAYYAFVALGWESLVHGVASALRAVSNTPRDLSTFERLHEEARKLLDGSVYDRRLEEEKQFKPRSYENWIRAQAEMEEKLRRQQEIEALKKVQQGSENPEPSNPPNPGIEIDLGPDQQGVEEIRRALSGHREKERRAKSIMGLFFQNPANLTPGPKRTITLLTDVRITEGYLNIELTTTTQHATQAGVQTSDSRMISRIAEQRGAIVGWEGVENVPDEDGLIDVWIRFADGRKLVFSTFPDDYRRLQNGLLGVVKPQRGHWR